MSKILIGVLCFLAFSTYLFLNDFIPVSTYPVVTFFLYLWFIAMIAIALQKEWGRKLIVVTSVFMSLYLMFYAGETGETRSIPVILLLVVIILYYILPKTKMTFLKSQTGEQKWGVHKRILVVDDDKVLLKMLRANLMSHGMEVLTADTGEKGLDLALRKNPHLIVLDVILPGVKGREVCARIKENKRTKDIPVIFLTAKDSPDDVQAEIKAGALMHLTKPVDPNQLLTVIKNILKG